MSTTQVTNQQQPTIGSWLRKLSGAHLQEGNGFPGRMVHGRASRALCHNKCTHTHWKVLMLRLGIGMYFSVLAILMRVYPEGCEVGYGFILSPPPSVLEKPKRRGRYTRATYDVKHKRPRYTFWWRSSFTFCIVLVRKHTQERQGRISNEGKFQNFLFGDMSNAFRDLLRTRCTHNKFSVSDGQETNLRVL